MPGTVPEISPAASPQLAIGVPSVATCCLAFCRQAVGLEEALWRVQAFAEAGADVLFIDALASVEEMQAFCSMGQ